MKWHLLPSPQNNKIFVYSTIWVYYVTEWFFQLCYILKNVMIKCWGEINQRYYCAGISMEIQWWLVLNCQLDTTHNHVGRVSIFRKCLDQVECWGHVLWLMWEDPSSIRTVPFHGLGLNCVSRENYISEQAARMHLFMLTVDMMCWAAWIPALTSPVWNESWNYKPNTPFSLLCCFWSGLFVKQKWNYNSSNIKWHTK